MLFGITETFIRFGGVFFIAVLARCSFANVPAFVVFFEIAVVAGEFPFGAGGVCGTLDTGSLDASDFSVFGKTGVAFGCKSLTVLFADDQLIRAQFSRRGDLKRSG